jgi:hypothetical protein
LQEKVRGRVFSFAVIAKSHNFRIALDQTRRPWLRMAPRARLASSREQSRKSPIDANIFGHIARLASSSNTTRIGLKGVQVSPLSHHLPDN